MIVLVDNYDSFSYNLYQFLGAMDPDVRVVRNDSVTVEEVDAMAPDAIVLSPGPGRPEGAGICVELVRVLGPKYPILGVCLGHQAICVAYGATVTYAPHLMHGKQSTAFLCDDPLFEDMERQIPVARYHSLAVDPSTLPKELGTIAIADDGTVMAVKHREYDVYGLQFHPESIMTPDGATILKNFINIAGRKDRK